MDTTTADSTAMMHGSGVRSDRTSLWWGTLLTALVAVLFPRLNAVLHENQAFWQLDREGAIGIPAIVAVTLALFALLGRWAWRNDDTRNRPAMAGLPCGILALAGAVAFFVSAPIVLGGLALTFGLEGMRRAPFEGKRRRAVAAIVLGSVAVLAGVILWLAA